MVRATRIPDSLINNKASYITDVIIVNKTIVKKRPCAMVPSIIHESCEQSLGNGKSVDNSQIHLGDKVHELGVVAVGVRGIAL